jgi:leucine dehydrogenase
MVRYDYEQLVLCHDSGVGLRAAIAIHDTTLGPALGGVRMWPYASEEEALLDVLRLARAMTYKAAVAGLDLGGGKAVIIGDPVHDKTEALFRSLGRFVESLGGRYVTTEDVGTTMRDMEYISTETTHVTGLPVGLGGSGDPSPVTALGVHEAMRACALEVFGSDSLKGKTVALQGVGKVGGYLAEFLHEDGVRLIVSDMDGEKAQRAKEKFGAEVVAYTDIYDVECDIFSPCALGATINSQTIPRLRCRIVCGGANNQLEEEEDSFRLERKDILYAPDYVANGGGIINLDLEFTGYNEELARERTLAIYQTMQRVIARAKAERIPPAQAADHMAEERIQAVRRVRNLY